jgi:hypothetical protein
MSKSKLRLGPLPRTESVKLTFTCPASLKTELDRYAALHAQNYGRRWMRPRWFRRCWRRLWPGIEGSGGTGKVPAVNLPDLHFP